MAEELRLALILLGSLAIGSVILHGIWTVRKSVSQEKKTAKSEEKAQAEQLQNGPSEEAPPLKQMEMNFASEVHNVNQSEGLPVVDVNVDAIYKNEEVNSAAPQQQEYRDELNTRHQDMFSLAEELDETEPTLGNFSALDDEPIISVESPTENQSQGTRSTSQQMKSASEQKQPEKQDVLMLFVSKPNGEEISGAKLLPMLLTLGFKFGEMDFFHRHENSSGQGEVLFSLANMYNPGTFDIDRMEQMSTRGLTIFMTLPNAADPLQTFNLMHKAAKSIAQEFGAELLDSNRQPVDVGIVRGYVERIRKF